MVDPLHGITLETLLKELIEAYGFEELGRRVPIHCFQNEPSLTSSLKFLRRTPWARAKVESFYLFHLRDKRRRARRGHGDDLRATAGLVVSATKSVTGVVHEMQKAAAVAVVGVVSGVVNSVSGRGEGGEAASAVGAATNVVGDVVYGSVKGVTHVVGRSVDVVVAAIAPLLGDSRPGEEREALLAVLNGVVGDRLAEKGSPLAIPMALRPPLEGLHRGGTLLVLVHGSCMNDLQWRRGDVDFGTALAHDLDDVTPVYAHYNSGKHISENGADFAAVLEAESGPFSRIVFVGHSMGGLVIRSALAVADAQGLAFRQKVDVVVTLGTPHQGAPAERAGHFVEQLMALSAISAPLSIVSGVRGAGITDLRYGAIRESDWQAIGHVPPGDDPRTPTPLPAGVRCYAVAGTVASDKGVFAGDGIVPVDSALGRNENAAFALAFDEAVVVPDCHHVALLSQPKVYAHLRRWLAPQPTTP
jgi:uncharacterized protein (DUF2132 family)/pimeloyl-ACP methyl ester carboxylesterase